MDFCEGFKEEAERACWSREAEKRIWLRIGGGRRKVLRPLAAAALQDLDIIALV